MTGAVLRKATAQSVLSIVCIALTCGGCNRLVGDGIQAQVLTGAKDAIRSVDVAPATATASRFIGRGDHVQTDAATVKVVRLLPGILIQLTNAADLVFEEARLGKDGNDTADAIAVRSSRARLITGTAVAWVTAKSSETRLHLEVAGAVLSATAESLFMIEPKGKGTRVVCARGTVEIENAKVIPVAEGESYEWPAGDASGVSEGVTAASPEELTRISELAVLMQNASEPANIEVAEIRR